MTRKILVDEDHALNQLKNIVIDKQATDPGTGTIGQLYFNTTNDILKYYDGTTWQTVADTAGGGGTVTSVSVTAANGFDGTVATSTSTPAITIKATPTGILKSNGTAISAATAGTDYYAPGGTDVSVSDGGTGASTLSGVLKGNGTSAVTGSATINDLGSQTGDYSANSHKITNLTDPSSAQDAATKNYVDLTAQGLNVKPSVRVATTSSNSFTISAGNVTQISGTTVDGVSPSVGDRILIKDAPASTGSGSANSTQPGNGIYTVTSNTTNLSVSRATDMSGSNGPAGAYTFVEAGTANVSAGFVVSTPSSSAAFTYGTNNIAWTQFSGAGEITAGTGLSKSANTLSIDTTVTVDKTTAQALTHKDLTDATNTFPTFNQNTTGSAAKWTTARNLAGNSVDGSANVAFANKFIVQGTSDSGLSAAQFLGSLGTGLVKNTTTTGVLSIATSGTDYAPATSGSSILKGNGSGGFSSATSGTDYAPATSGSNILKGNGSGGFSSAKFTATIGDGSTTAIAVTHSLGTQDVIAQVRDASTNAVVECDITQTSTTVTTFTFAVAPASNAYKVVIIG